MHAFISYARSDVADVRQLRRDIERSGHDVWIDDKLEGGQDWWRQILDRIASSCSSSFAASPDSIQSRACYAELDVRDRAESADPARAHSDLDMQTAPDPLSSLQAIDYRERTPDCAIELTSAIGRSWSPGALPDPLPLPPPPPFRSFGPLRELLSLPVLTHVDQRGALDDLRERAGNIDERARR